MDAPGCLALEQGSGHLGPPGVVGAHEQHLWDIGHDRLLQAMAGLTARMIAECIPGAASVVKVTDASANPAVASPSRYSERDSAPAMQPAYEPAALRSAA